MAIKGRMTCKIKFRDKEFTAETHKVLSQALDDVTQDLVNMSSQSAPVDEHILEGKYDVKEKDTNKLLERIVSYSVLEEDFNYAYFVHENHPIGGLGEKTRKKPAGQSAITGKTYPAGGKFLTAPLAMNRKGYINYIQKEYNKYLEK
jgi:hypothetical protein